MTDQEVCPWHLGSAGKATTESRAAKLRAAGDKALKTLIWAMDHVEQYPAEAVRASDIIMARVYPKPGPQFAVNVGMIVGAVDSPKQSSAEIIRARMAALVAAPADHPPTDYADLVSESRAQAEDAAWSQPPADDDQVVDAELVEPVPATPHVRPPPRPAPATDADLGQIRLTPQPVPRSYGVPGTTVRQTSFEEIAGRRHA